MYTSLDIVCNIVYNIFKKGDVMNPRKITIKELETNGYALKRHGANHDLYFNSITKKTIPVKRHDFNENDMKYIFKEAGIKKRN